MILNVRENYYKLFEDAPVAAAILDTQNLNLEMANQSMLNLWHRPSSILGTGLLEFLPELEGQEYPNILKNVISTGLGHRETGARVILDRHEKQESVFMDYSYTPINLDGKGTTAILVMATDVCEREMNRLNMQQSKRDLRAMVMAAPVPMCIYRDASFNIEAVNDLMLDLWQGNRKMNLAALHHVYHNGIAYTCTDGGITYSYTPLRNGSLHINAVCVVAVRN